MLGTGRMRYLAVSLVFALQATVLLSPVTPVGAQASIRDYPIPGGWFYSQESRDPGTAPFRGYTVIDDADASFWTEFRRFGEVAVLGYPVSQRYRYPDDNGPLHQAFQRGILQWQPEQGRAVLANVFEQFTEKGLDDALEIAGIPRPRPSSDLPFAEDAERRMTWITEPRFLARFFFDPVSQTPWEVQEEAWNFFGLPQSFPERPVYYREKLNGKFGHPLYLPYIAQRFQKGAIQLFLEETPNDPTIVPGDGKQGCVSMTAVGRLARRLGAGSIIPNLATQPLPLEDPPRVRFFAFVPTLTSPGQRTIQFEIVGTGFQPGEPITIRLTPTDEFGTPLVYRVDAADADGSFDQVITHRIGVYTVSITGERSRKTLDQSQNATLDLTTPTSPDAAGAASRTTYC